MLEWIADLESSPNHRGTTKILCPQCKAEIKVARPRDVLVLLSNRINRVASSLIVPTAIGTVTGVLYSSAVVYGINAINLVFGAEDAREMLAPAIVDLQQRANPQVLLFERLCNLTDPFLPTGLNMNWKLFLGLPLISPALILSRTTLMDQTFALLPLSVSTNSPSRRRRRRLLNVIVLFNWISVLRKMVRPTLSTTTY
jgi:hypothetical protein